MKTPWNEDEDAAIRGAYARAPKHPNLAALGVVLDRGVTAVANRAKKLGLSAARMEPSKQRLAAEMVSQGSSLSVTADRLGATKMQVRHACKKHGVKPCLRSATDARRSGPSAVTPPNVQAAMQLVASGQMSMTQAALVRGITLKRLAYYCRRDGIVSKFSHITGAAS
ncbi:MAG: hypothetical protein RLZZ450_50 [Pseudomonadota bacterium]|jgi:hypothetical protein